MSPTKKQERPMPDATRSKSLRSKIKKIQFFTRYLVNDLFSGEYQSAFKGRGMTFEEVREYQAGDDIRNIDWNVTARTNRPHVKIYRDERELTVLFLVDISASTHFGTVSKFKNEMAAEITALLAYAALKQNDKVGLLIFSDGVEHYIPPKKGRGHTMRLIRDILSFQARSKKTDFSVPLAFLNRVIKKRAVLFLLSDFQTIGYENALKNTARRHDLTAISLTDPKERAIPVLGFLEMEDAETGETILINTRRLQSRFSALNEERRRALRAFFQSAGIDLIEISTEAPYLTPIMKFFRYREKKRYGRT